MPTSPPSLPLVSILTPSFNQVAFVEEALRSVLSQDYPHVEQIVVDAGSTDGTLDVLRRYESGALRVRVLQGSSQSEALNVAIGESRGEVIGWLNTDDAYFATDTVRTAVEEFRRDPGAVVVYGDAVMADGRGRVVRHVHASARDLGRLQTWSPLVQPSAFIRRRALAERFVRDDLELFMDYELWLWLSRRGRFRKVPRILAIDRDYPARKTRAGVGRAEELERVGRAYGLARDPRPPLVARGGRWARRVRGVLPLLTIERRYTLAFPALIEPGWRRVVRQLAVPQTGLRGE